VTRVVWTRPALEDVRQIREYIARDSPRYGQAVAERLFAAVERLHEYPLSGRVVPELEQPTVREVIEPPYRIVYRVRADVLEVLTVVHSSRQFPADELRPLR
jgi:addiction module RelE/StbE family toxin